ncbi:PAS domain S-box-containing protein [Bradyrhizobium sp. USDA 372]
MTMRELVPGIEESIIEHYRLAEETGQPQRFVSHVAVLNRWFEIEATSATRPGRIAILFRDISQRKHAEAVLRENEERQAFLLKLTDALRPLADAQAIQATTARLLGAHLGVDRAMYAEVTGEPGSETGVIRGQFIRPATPGRPAPPPFPDRFTYESFGTDVMGRRYSGEGLAVADVNADAGFDAIESAAWASVGVRAAIVAPLVKSKRLVAELGVHSETARIWTQAEISLVHEVGERTWAAAERARAEAALRESEERFRQFADASSDVLWIRDAHTLAATYVSAAAARVYGTTPESLIDNQHFWDSLIVPEDRSRMRVQLENVGRGEALLEEFRILRPSDNVFRWIRRAAFPLIDAQGQVQGVAGISSDVTETRLLTDHQAVLLAELQHRVRNIMAMMRSVTSRTAERADSVADYASLMAGRLLALSRVQALLTRAANASVDIKTIVSGELNAQAHHSNQFSTDGPDIELSPKASEVLTLAFHELTTNALKYGALSSTDGKVSVFWTTFERRGTTWLGLDWIEGGAPRAFLEVGKRPRRGFGTELIEGRIPYELGGRGSVSVGPNGARCRLEFPLGAGASILQTDAPQAATVFGGALDMGSAPDLNGKTVLVVEDDYYQATDTARALAGAGANVIGPCPTEDAARIELGKQRPDAVVLDINLGERPTFELSATLLEQSIPFVFVTGYDQDVIPEGYEHIERIQKPVLLRQIVETVSRLGGTAVQ